MSEFVDTVLTGSINMLRGTSRKFISTIPGTSATILSYSTGPAPPLVRIGQTMVYLSNKLYVFGGSDPDLNTYYGDFYEFNLLTNTWTALSTIGGPTARSFSASVVDLSGNIYIFGGNNGLTLYAEIWKYNTTTSTWSLLSNTGPSVRSGHGMYFDNNFIYVFGGQTTGNVFLNDMWRFNISNNTWVQITYAGPPPPSSKIYFASTITLGYIFIFGGYDGSVYDTLFAYNIVGNIWLDLSIPGAPSPRCNSGMIGVAGNLYILNGSSTPNGTAIDDMWKYDYFASTWTELTTSTRPSARVLSSMVTDGSKIYVGFGGLTINSGPYYNNIASAIESSDPIIFSNLAGPGTIVNNTFFNINNYQISVSIEGGFAVITLTINLTSYGPTTFTSIIVNVT